MHSRPEIKPDLDMDLHDAIQRIALEGPSYGRPRITHELRRRGWRVNAKESIQAAAGRQPAVRGKRKFIVTTNSNHGLQVYPNLAFGMVLTVLPVRVVFRAAWPD
jgi:putative transposase